LRRDRDRRPVRASGMVPPGRTPCPVGPSPRGVVWFSCVFVCVCLCMVLCSARGRADTSALVPP
jgi:hypothetical protein